MHITSAFAKWGIWILTTSTGTGSNDELIEQALLTTAILQTLLIKV